MRIAIIGGGAAGLITAYLLDRHHGVTLYEKASVLGGHIRTLGLNVKEPAGLHAPHPLDAGVLEFDCKLFPTVDRLFRRLEVPTEALPAATTLFCADGRRILAPGAIPRAGLSGVQLLRAWLAALRLNRARRRFLSSTDLPMEELYRRSLGDFLDPSDYSLWLELLAMYAYSTPRESVAGMPAALVVPMLRRFANADDWIRVVGGTYLYVQAITDRFRGTICTGADIRAVTRTSGGNTIEFRDRSRCEFDAVVFATPPGEILPLLADASSAERDQLRPWKTREIETMIHCDFSPYERRGARFATEFDVFELPGGRGGYNALLNLLCGLPETEHRRFGLAFGMDDEIDPGRVLHVQKHRVPVLALDALRSREAIKQSNGHNNTWLAGAWLYDGLHEGAATSAAVVAKALGGDSL